ncbi:MAG: leucine-rich repeat domain-containing protein [Christensenellaceae bacterium]
MKAQIFPPSRWRREIPSIKATKTALSGKADNVLIAGCKTSVIPDYVETIGENAFKSCQGLTEITVPAGVRKIDKDAFADCRNLTSITLSEGLKEIDSPPFYNCINLTALEIPASVEFIPEGLTSFCQNLSKLTVKEGNPVYKSDGNCILRKSDNQLVAGCKTSVIPAYVKRIGPYAFQGCSFTSIVIPEGVEKIGSNAFTSSQLTEITLPNTLTTIEVGAFSSCEKLHSKRALAIPESVKEIQQGAFLDSPFLIVLLPDSVERLARRRFSLRTFIPPPRRIIPRAGTAEILQFWISLGITTAFPSSITVSSVTTTAALTWIPASGRLSMKIIRAASISIQAVSVCR